jgi:hypothetical protein
MIQQTQKRYAKPLKHTITRLETTPQVSYQLNMQLQMMYRQLQRVKETIQRVPSHQLLRVAADRQRVTNTTETNPSLLLKVSTKMKKQRYQYDAHHDYILESSPKRH